jgi:hypothetical protein
MFSYRKIWWSFPIIILYNYIYYIYIIIYIYMYIIIDKTVLRREVATSYEISVLYYQLTRRHFLEDASLHSMHISEIAY